MFALCALRILYDRRVSRGNPRHDGNGRQLGNGREAATNRRPASATNEMARRGDGINNMRLATATSCAGHGNSTRRQRACRDSNINETATARRRQRGGQRGGAGTGQRRAADGNDTPATTTSTRKRHDTDNSPRTSAAHVNDSNATAMRRQRDGNVVDNVVGNLGLQSDCAATPL